VNAKKNLNQICLLIAAALCISNYGFAQTWTQANAPYDFWFSVASSADGSKMVAAAFGANNGASGAIYTSTNSGSSWITNGMPAQRWIFATSSADGNKLAAMNTSGAIYISTNSGAIWTLATNLPALQESGTSMASSADGNKLIVAYPEGVFRSVDLGITWITNSVTTNNLTWLFLASSADASKLAAADNYGYIYTSTNSGATWIQTSAPLGNWQGVASSADGNRLAAVDRDFSSDFLGPIYTSTNAGLTWISNNVPSEQWTSISSSADGRILVAVAFESSGHGPIYISTNSGASWALDAVSNYWGAVASSADGTKLVAATGNSGVYGGTKSFTAGYIYTSQIKSSSRMNITPTNSSLKLSWIIPSTNFVMQQSADLHNWADMTNQPVLNLTNLQNEANLPLPGSNVFYRLKTP
jgi:photosystem II stability/assembly factor-like uncharacterized protein